MITADEGATMTGMEVEDDEGAVAERGCMIGERGAMRTGVAAETEGGTEARVGTDPATEAMTVEPDA